MNDTTEWYLKAVSLGYRATSESNTTSSLQAGLSMVYPNISLATRGNKMSSFPNQKQNTQGDAATTPLEKTSSSEKTEITEEALEHTSESLRGKPSGSIPDVAGGKDLGGPTCNAGARGSNQTVKTR